MLSQRGSTAGPEPAAHSSHHSPCLSSAAPTHFAKIALMSADAPPKTSAEYPAVMSSGLHARELV